MVAFTILCLINGFDVFFPGRFTAANFLTAYVGIPLFLAFYFGHRFVAWRRGERWAKRSEEVDLYSGLDQILAEEIPEVESKGWAAKVKNAVW